MGATKSWVGKSVSQCKEICENNALCTGFDLAYGKTCWIHTNPNYKQDLRHNVKDTQAFVLERECLQCEHWL